MFFDWVKVLHPSWHRIGHCGGILPSQSLGLVLKKLNPTQQTASDARIKWSKLTQETHKMMNLNKHTKTKSKPTCNTWVSYSLSVKTLYHTRCTSPSTSALRQTSRLDIVSVRPRHRLWLCAIRGCRRTATELSRSPPRESGTVCHITTRLHSHCLFFAVVWRLISSVAAFLDYIVVPAKWHSSLWTR